MSRDRQPKLSAEPRDEAVQTHLVISLVCSSELTDQADKDQLSDLWQLRIDNSYERREDRGEGKRRRLSTHERPCEQALSTDQVLAKQLRHDVLDIRYVDLMSDSIHSSRTRSDLPC